MGNHGNSKITLDRMNDLFTILSNKLIANNMTMELVLCGGAAMLIYGAREMTADIDTIRQLKAQHQRLIESIAIEIGVELDWLNDDSYDPAPNNLPYVQYRQYPNLSVHILTEEAMLVTKIAAGRDKDYVDAEFWVDRLEIKTKRQLESLCHKYDVALSYDEIELEIQNQFNDINEDWGDDPKILIRNAHDKVNMRKKIIDHLACDVMPC